MFPIPWNKAFRKKDGTVVNIADAMSGGGGGSDLPPHSSSDAGKVLTVGDDGSLEWDEAGAGGGDEVILDYFEMFEQGSGPHSYNHEITINASGIYSILVGGFCTSSTIQKNNVTIPNSFNDEGDYAHYYHAAALELAANDVITITMASSGKTTFFANVVKKAPEV